MAKQVLNVRIAPDLKERLRKEAEKQNRNLSNLVETLLANALQAGK